MNLENRKCSVSVGLALLCATAGMATGAIAEPTSDSISVRYVSTELTTPEGARALYTHIRRAAKLVCHEPDIRDLAGYRIYQECYEQAVDAAVTKVDSTAVTALHRGKNGHSAAG
jgi:UrcA family protein